MKTFGKFFIFSIFIFAAMTGCSVAVPNVTNLLSSLNSFKLTQNDLSIDSLTDLSNIVIDANCDSTNLSFKYELTDIAPGTWTDVPTTTPNGFFTSITNNCTTTGKIHMILDLSSTPPFMSMIPNDMYRIKFKDVNMLPDLSLTEEFRIRYSLFTLSDDRFNNGQGLNNTKMGTTHSLKGRIINVQQIDPATSSSYTLEGKVVFQ